MTSSDKTVSYILATFPPRPPLYANRRKFCCAAMEGSPSSSSSSWPCCCLSDCAAAMPMLLLLGFPGNPGGPIPSSCCSEAAALLDGSESHPSLWGDAVNPEGPISLSDPKLPCSWYRAHVGVPCPCSLLEGSEPHPLLGVSCSCSLLDGPGPHSLLWGLLEPLRDPSRCQTQSCSVPHTGHVLGCPAPAHCLPALSWMSHVSAMSWHLPNYLSGAAQGEAPLHQAHHPPAVTYCQACSCMQTACSLNSCITNAHEADDRVTSLAHTDCVVISNTT